jgi:hypothetical protein
LVKHLVALGIKFIILSIPLFILWPLLGSAAFLTRLILGLSLTLITYVINDLVFLPQIGSLSTSIIDGILVALVVFIGQFFTRNMEISFIAAIVLGILIGLGEWYFHKFVKSAVLSP